MTPEEIQREREAEWRDEDKQFYSQNGCEIDNSHITEEKEFNNSRGV
jgi:hypothetical protein